MPFVTSDSLKLHYEIEGQGLPVLFLHGYTATISLWDAQNTGLKPTFTVIRLDQRGHGKSEGSSQHQYTLPNLAKDALAVLDDADIPEAVIVGHSMGGMVAFELLAHHSVRVRAAVFSSTTPIAPAREYFADTVEFARTLGQIPESVRAADPMMQSSVPLDEATALGCGEMIMSMSGYLEALENNPTPSLIVHGSEDSKSIRDGSKALAGKLANVTYVTIEGAGHVPQITHTDEYNGILVEFLNGVS